MPLIVPCFERSPAPPPGRRRAAAAAATLFCWAAFVPPAAAADRTITLDETVALAVRRNLDLRAASFDPAVAVSSARRELALYDTALQSRLRFESREDKIAPLAPDPRRTQTVDAEVAASRRFPTGATASLSFTNLFTRTEPGTSPARTAAPELTLAVSQPLLKGAGREAAERGIVTARLASEAAARDWSAKARNTAAAARDAFFALVKARSALDTRSISLETARALHARNQARVRAGLLAAVELLDSELGVAQREKDLLEAEKAFRDAADALRVLIQAAPDETLVPAEPPPPPDARPEEGEALAAALDRRAEIASARIALRTAEFNARVAGQDVLPDLSLTGSAAVSGLAEDYGGALSDIAAARYPAWSAGLSFSYPIGNRAAREDLAAARLRAAQAALALRAIEESVGLEVRSALREIETRRKQVDVATKGLELAEARLASFLKRASVGLATTKDTLQAEADRVAARDALAAARADLHGAFTRLWRSTGELLERHGIRVEYADLHSAAPEEAR